MRTSLLRLVLASLLAVPAVVAAAGDGTPVAVPFDAVVALDGSGGFATIQAALDSLADTATRTRVVLVRRGVYRERLFVTKSRLAIVGEDREGTRIEQGVLRREWRKSHPDDWGAAVVNIGDRVSDVVLANLTIRNDYGAATGDRDHQFAIRAGGDVTRIALLHANVLSEGGDTVSVWNPFTGLTYHASCTFEGWVDFVCPRGSAFVTNSRFLCHSPTAAIWHDGSKDRDHRLVVRASRFEGDPGFALGRTNRDGQIYLLDSGFSDAMADRPVYQASAPETYAWEPRTYFHGCRGDDGERSWFADNLASADFSPRPGEIDPEWTFCGQWDPEATLPEVLPYAALPRPYDGADGVPIAGARLAYLPARGASRHELFLGTSASPPLAATLTTSSFDTGPLAPGTTYRWRVDAVGPAGRVTGETWQFTTGSAPIRIALAGDSTVTGEEGWGKGFAARLGAGLVAVGVPRGGGGSRGVAAKGYWESVLAARPDYVLIQPGHDDDGPGQGPRREGQPDRVSRENLARMVAGARAGGISPVLVTPPPRRALDTAGGVRSDLDPRAEGVRAVAREQRVPLIDLHERSLDLVQGMRPEEVVVRELARAVPRLAPGLERTLEARPATSRRAPSSSGARPR